MSDPIHFSLADATAAVTAARESGEASFSVRATRGTMVLELYAPRGVDEQSPHSQDELYFVVSGTGSFVCAGERVEFVAGDALFAAAGVEHHFEDFSDDFATWVVFYGSEGGEIPG